jgi:hypothetical protein
MEVNSTHFYFITRRSVSCPGRPTPRKVFLFSCHRRVGGTQRCFEYLVDVKSLWLCCQFFFFNRHYNPSRVSACSTDVEHSQQEGFTECRCQRHVKSPNWRRTGDLERSNFRHKTPPASEATRPNLAAEGGTMGEKWPRNFAESGDFHVTFGFFYMP